jgi:hypothetical protein
MLRVKKNQKDQVKWSGSNPLISLMFFWAEKVLENQWVSRGEIL